jgi:hypothetical protein
MQGKKGDSMANCLGAAPLVFSTIDGPMDDNPPHFLFRQPGGLPKAPFWGDAAKTMLPASAGLSFWRMLDSSVRESEAKVRLMRKIFP